MENKNNVKNSEMTTRKMVVVDKKEIKQWSRVFSLFGQKLNCYRETSVAPKTIKKIMETGEGFETAVNAIRNYCESQKQSA